MPTKAILFLFGCSEVNSAWLITSKLANQRARKVLFTCVVYTKLQYLKRKLHQPQVVFMQCSILASAEFLWREENQGPNNKRQQQRPTTNSTHIITPDWNRTQATTVRGIIPVPRSIGQNNRELKHARF